MNVRQNASVAKASSGATSLRTGEEYLRSLRDGRQVFVDGEAVKDVTTHRAFTTAASKGCDMGAPVQLARAP